MDIIKRVSQSATVINSSQFRVFDVSESIFRRWPLELKAGDEACMCHWNRAVDVSLAQTLVDMLLQDCTPSSV